MCDDRRMTIAIELGLGATCRIRRHKSHPFRLNGPKMEGTIRWSVGFDDDDAPKLRIQECRFSTAFACSTPRNTAQQPDTKRVVMLVPESAVSEQ